MQAIEQLVVRAQSGDTEAFAMLVERFQDMAYAYAYSYLHNFHWAQDVAQNAFIEAYTALGDLREPVAFPGWFRRILFKHCDRLTRRSQPTLEPLEEAAHVPSEEPGPAEQLDAGELRERVLRALRSLPEHERVVTALYYMNGYTQVEIAEFLEVPSSTVRGRLYTSRKRLREEMIDMVQDTLRTNPLPPDFSAKVIGQAEEYELFGYPHTTTQDCDFLQHVFAAHGKAINHILEV